VREITEWDFEQLKFLLDEIGRHKKRLWSEVEIAQICAAIALAQRFGFNDRALVAVAYIAAPADTWTSDRKLCRLADLSRAELRTFRSVVDELKADTKEAVASALASASV